MGSWLSEIDLDRNKISLSGLSDNAAALLATLERLDHLQNLKFDEPVAVDERQNKDRFRLSATVVAQKDGGAMSLFESRSRLAALVLLLGVAVGLEEFVVAPLVHLYGERQAKISVLRLRAGRVASQAADGPTLARALASFQSSGKAAEVFWPGATDCRCCRRLAGKNPRDAAAGGRRHRRNRGYGRRPPMARFIASGSRFSSRPTSTRPNASCTRSNP